MLKGSKKNQKGIAEIDKSPINTVIGAEIVFEGNIIGGQSIKIDGKINGNVTVNNGIILGEKAQVKGDLKSKNIVIYGLVEGNVDCEELMLQNTGKILGDISTRNLQIEKGGKFDGKVEMKNNPTPSSSVRK